MAAVATPILDVGAYGFDEMRSRKELSGRLSILVNQVPHMGKAKWSGSAIFAFALGNTLPAYQLEYGPIVGEDMFWAWYVQVY
jgi:hypothetical protein